MKTNHKYSVVALSIMATTINAQAEIKQLPKINVVAEFNEQQSPTSHEVSQEQIQKNHAIDLKTSIKDVPGVEVIGLQGARQGNDSVTIRGLSGNRVGLSIDGINLSEANENKQHGSVGVIFGRANTIEPASLKAISINKNSGANGVAGSVNMRTLKPSDLLNGKDHGGQLETNFNSVDNSVLLSAGVAVSQNNSRTMVFGTFRQGHETKNKGDKDTLGVSRTKSDPSNYFAPYILAKHEIDINENNTITLAAENIYKVLSLDPKSELEAQTNQAGNFYIAKYEANNTNQRSRLSINHNYQSVNSFFNEIDSSIYWQHTKTDSKSYREGNGFTRTQKIGNTNYERYSPEGFRRQNFSKNDNIFGITSKLMHHSSYELGIGKLNYNGLYSFDINYQILKSNWDSNYLVYKSKPVADSILLPINLLTDNEFILNDLTLNLGLGLHYYLHKPENDKNYLTNTENEIAKIKTTSGFNFTPKIGLSWQINELATPYAQYTRGFKAPSPQQLTSTYNFEIVESVWGNPNLKSETSNNFDLGIKGNSDKLQYNVNAYYNLYNNFIEIVRLAKPLTGQRFTYQAQNTQKVTIYGAEASANWNFHENFSVNGLISYAKGEVDKNNKKTPLNSIDPLKIKLGLAYDNDDYGLSLDIDHHLAKDNKDLHVYNNVKRKDVFNPSTNYTLIDLGAYYKPTQNLIISAKVNNLLNKKYWKWSDIAYLVSSAEEGQDDYGLSKLSNDNKDRYTSPGINFSFGLKYTF